MLVILLGGIYGVGVIWSARRGDRQRASLPRPLRQELQGASSAEISAVSAQHRLLAQTMSVVEVILADPSIWTYLPPELTKDLKDLREQYRKLL